jgi:hypothetical protein
MLEAEQVYKIATEFLPTATEILCKVFGVTDCPVPEIVLAENRSIKLDENIRSAIPFVYYPLGRNMLFLPSALPRWSTTKIYADKELSVKTSVSHEDAHFVHDFTTNFGALSEFASGSHGNYLEVKNENGEIEICLEPDLISENINEAIANYARDIVLRSLGFHEAADRENSIPKRYAEKFLENGSLKRGFCEKVDLHLIDLFLRNQIKTEKMTIPFRDFTKDASTLAGANAKPNVYLQMLCGAMIEISVFDEFSKRGQDYFAQYAKAWRHGRMKDYCRGRRVYFKSDSFEGSVRAYLNEFNEQLMQRNSPL